MAIEELKQKLHALIESSNNATLLEDLWMEAQSRSLPERPNDAEGLSQEDYEELVSLATEPAEKDTVSYNELKASLSKWFTK